MCDQQDGGGLRDEEDELPVSDESEAEDGCRDEDEESCDQAAVAQFSIRGGGSAFSYRTRNIFDVLDRVTMPTSSSSSSSLNHQAPYRKTSQPPPSSTIPAKRKGTPDYLLHPENWTHYSLDGVSESSEQGNAAAAFSFLSELQERKEKQKRSEGKQQEEEEKQNRSDSSSCDLKHRMIFCRPNIPKRKAAAAERRKEKETHLSHLQEEEEEEEEEEKQKHMESGTERETGKGVKEEEVEEAAPLFSFKKMRSKNYRRSSEGELFTDISPTCSSDDCVGGARNVSCDAGELSISTEVSHDGSKIRK